MPPHSRLIVRWIVGSLAGTLVIALTSPLFVRSYAPLRVDPVRRVWTLPPRLSYRWRSEGYADTVIGPLGMPGKGTSDLLPPPREDASLRGPENRYRPLRVALWGDSQAEGVCVADDLKLHAQAERIASGSLSVFPLARSGEHAAVWLTQMPAIESELAIDVHVLLIVDLPDLLTAPLAPLLPPAASEIDRANSAIAAQLPAFMIQGARRLMTEPDGVSPRKLRFSVGPERSAISPRSHASHSAPGAPEWLEVMTAVRRSTDLPLIILYAPKLPLIVHGDVITKDSQASEFEAMSLAAKAAGLIVVDVHRDLLRSMRFGKWPHGFHNGVIGSGHLNANGYHVVATGLVNAITRLTEQVD